MSTSGSILERRNAALRHAWESLDALADEAYASRAHLKHDHPLYSQDLTAVERRHMTAALLRSLIDYEAFEFVAEPADNMQLLNAALADFLLGDSDAPVTAFMQLRTNAMDYAASYIDAALERRCPPDHTDEP
jgi:hypothetical protein